MPLAHGKSILSLQQPVAKHVDSSTLRYGRDITPHEKRGKSRVDLVERGTTASVGLHDICRS